MVRHLKRLDHVGAVDRRIVRDARRHNKEGEVVRIAVLSAPKSEGKNQGAFSGFARRRIPRRKKQQGAEERPGTVYSGQA